MKNFVAEITQKESDAFRALSQSHDGKTLIEFLERESLERTRAYAAKIRDPNELQHLMGEIHAYDKIISTLKAAQNWRQNKTSVPDSFLSS